MFPGKKLQQRDLQLIMFFSNAATLIVFTFLVLLLKGNGIDEIQIALLAAAFSISMIITNTIFGRLSDVMGRRPFLILGFGFAAVSTFLYIYPTSFQWFFLLRIFNGIAFGIFPSSIVGVASDRKFGLGSLSSWGSLGWGVGALIGGFLSEVYTLNVAFILGSAFFTASFFIVLLWGTGKSSRTERSMTVDEVPLERHGNHDSPSAVTVQSSPFQSYWTSLKLNWQVYLVYLMRHGSANSIWIYWALFLQKNLSLNNFQIGIVQMTNMLTQFIVMKTFTDKFNPKKMFLSGAFISALAFYTFTLCTSFTQIVLTQVILGSSWAFFYVGALRSIEMNAKPYRIVATSTGLFNATHSLAQLVGPFIAIIVFSKYQTYTATMKLAALITVLAGFLYGIFYFLGSSTIKM